MLEAMFSWVTCPVCGEGILTMGVRVNPDHPEISAEECSKCGALVQVSRNPASGELVAKMRNEN